MSNKPNDIDPIETQEWLDALSSVLETKARNGRISYWKPSEIHPPARGAPAV